MARLDRLPTLREVAQLGAVLGRDFAYEMLRAITVLDEPRLRDVLGRLVEAELLYQRGRPPRSRYIFKHALIQDAAYQSLLQRTRQQYHRQVAELLESSFADTVEASPELVAHHYSEAGLPQQAVTCWQRAGEKALGQSGGDWALDGWTCTIGAAPRDAGAGEAGACPAAAARPGKLCHQRLRLPRGDPCFQARAGAVRGDWGRRQHLSHIIRRLAAPTDGWYHTNAETTANEILERAGRTDNTGALIVGNFALGTRSPSRNVGLCPPVTKERH